VALSDMFTIMVDSSPFAAKKQKPRFYRGFGGIF